MLIAQSYRHSIFVTKVIIGVCMQFTEHGMEGVVPLELLPPDVRSKYQAKPNDRSKRAKKEETKSTIQPEENQVLVMCYDFGCHCSEHCNYGGANVN